MNARLESLIDRGYSREDVMRLSSFTEKELDSISKIAFNHIKRGCFKVSKPSAIFIGGQPGCGKTILSMNYKNKIGNIVEIGIDNYRMYHPNYLQMEDCIRKHWEGRVESENDTPGNDIADFTHEFAGAMTDRLIDYGRIGSYNLLLEWGMREPKAPLNCMRQLKDDKYYNNVIFVATNPGISYEACRIRSDIMKNYGHIIRKVPKSFHDYSVKTLPESINKIYNEGKQKKIIDNFLIVNRNNEELWKNRDDIKPGDFFKEYLEKSVESENNKEYSIESNKKEMVGLKNEILNLIVFKPEINSSKVVIK